MALLDQHVREVCRFGQGADACKYVSFGNDGGFHCRKQDLVWKRILDIRSLDGLIAGKGDNCNGAESGSVSPTSV